MLKLISSFISRLFSPIDQKHELDVILSAKIKDKSYVEKLAWLRTLFVWLRSSSQLTENSPLSNEKIPSLRIKYLLQVLDRNLNWKENFILTFSSAFNELSSEELFAEVGISDHGSFIAEFTHRVINCLLLDGAVEKKLQTFLLNIFPDPDDVIWIDSIDDQTLIDFLNLFSSLNSDTFIFFNDLKNSLLLLSIQIQEIGLSNDIRHKINMKSVVESPFYKLNDFIQHNLNFINNSIEKKVYLQAFVLIEQCEVMIERVYQELNRQGILLHTVFQLDLLQKRIARFRLLFALTHAEERSQRSVRFLISSLVTDLHDSVSVRRFIVTNFNLILKKIVKRNSELGQAYLVKTSADYFKMFKKSLGGGLITGFTVYFKGLISFLLIAPLGLGFLYSFNYTMSFIGIYFLHFTLATKQPSSTAPHLASFLKKIKSSDSVIAFVNEVVYVLRAQFVAVIGNIISVVPTVLMICYFYTFLSGHAFVSEKKAIKYLESFDIFGPSIFYAILTGFLLFSSSIIAGWVDNWFTVHKISERVLGNERINYVFGGSFTLKLSHFFKDHIVGLAGNISLGFILGFIPEFFAFTGIPLDIRHVTLSAGTLAASISTLGYETIFTLEFIRAATGVIMIGIVNVVVSFTIALFVAMRAEGTQNLYRDVLFKEIISIVIKRPWVLIFPIAINKNRK